MGEDVLESVRNSDPGLGLVHLQENADDPGDGTEGRVEHVAVLRRRVHLLRLTVSHSGECKFILIASNSYLFNQHNIDHLFSPQPPGLVVKAVAAADKLPGKKTVLQAITVVMDWTMI